MTGDILSEFLQERATCPPECLPLRIIHRQEFICDILSKNKDLKYLAMMSREEVEQHCKTGLEYYDSKLTGNEVFVEYHAFEFKGHGLMVLQWRALDESTQSAPKKSAAEATVAKPKRKRRHKI